ncbi:SGNH/GDSL hydrolase family protein [Janthinobacterium sp. Mn2066]|uniref:SGNH/GDSL hydrolase family protein n=1 Tax=Janthinobacterium sp. Mn2066 TaxID=3395264 RepID=UPI003BD24FFC
MSTIFGNVDGLAAGIYQQVLLHLQQNPPVIVPPAGPENRTFIFDGESTNAPAAGGTGWVEVCKTMSAFAGGQFVHTAVPGRNMADTLAAYNANVRPAVLAAVAAGRTAFLFIQTGLNDYGMRPLAPLRDPFALYVERAIGDGAVVVPMTTTRRLDARGSEDVRQAFNAYILSLGLQYTVLTDHVFTDPQHSIPGAQTDDGTHPNAAKNREIANTVNAVITAGGSTFYDQVVEIARPLVAGQMPYVNYSGQLATDVSMSVDLSTNATKDLVQTFSASFSQTGKNAVRYSIPAVVAGGVTTRQPITFELATIGDVSNYHAYLARKFVLFDITLNKPLMAATAYGSALIGKWELLRVDCDSVPETPVGILTSYPVANNTPGVFGQVCINANGTKIAIYCGDGVTHKWAVSAATNVV